MTAARQMIAMIITVRKSNKCSLDRQTGPCPSSREKNPYIYSIILKITSQTDTCDEV